MLDSSIWNFLHPAHCLAHGSSPSVYAKLVTLARNQRVKAIMVTMTINKSYGRLKADVFIHVLYYLF